MNIVNNEYEDFHMHSLTFSDGMNSVDEIVNTMKKLWTNDALVEKLRSMGYQKSNNWQQSNFNTVFLKIINQVICKT